MNKERIIEILNQYNFDKDKFYVITGAALVLMGIIEQTKDIDICVENDYYKLLQEKYECKFERVNEFGNTAYMIDDIINLGTDFAPNDYEIISGYKVASLKDCYTLKKFLNRDKDNKLLKKMETMLNL